MICDESTSSRRIPTYTTIELGCHAGYHFGVGQTQTVLTPDPAFTWFTQDCDYNAAVSDSTGPTADGRWEFNACGIACPGGDEASGPHEFVDATPRGHSFANGFDCALPGTGVSLAIHCKGKAPPCDPNPDGGVDAGGLDAGGDATLPRDGGG